MNAPTGPRADRGKAASSTTQSTALPSSAMPPPPPPNGSASSEGMLESDPNFKPHMTDDDLSAIRSRYLGVDKKKRKIRKLNDRKFVFDWDAQDDTGADEVDIVPKQGMQVMFGRGRLAGMDDGGATGTRLEGTTGGMVLADAMERRMAAKQGIDDRHWTEKPLSEMKERDWRIFREDFSISARGTASILPTLRL